MFFYHHLFKNYCAGALILALSACSISTPRSFYVPFVNPEQGEQKRNNHLTTIAETDKWWQLFHDHQLDQLIAQALQQNYSLLATLARVQSAQAQLAVSTTSRYPDLNFTANGTADIESLDKVKSGSFGLSSSWELDLWGGIAALEEKAQWDLISKQALHKTRLNTVAGGVSATWLNWLAESHKKQLLAAQYQRTETALSVINRRFALGKNSVTDIWQQKRLLESIISQQATNQARLQTYKKQLAVWLGTAEYQLPELAQIALPKLNILPEQTIPLQALHARPDIQQAYANLQASDASLAAAVTEKFPRLTLRANYSTSKSSTVELFDDWLGNLAASLVMPIFNAGEIDNKIKQREYNLAASYADFSQAWLDAIYDVEVSLINEQQLYQISKQLHLQLTLAKKTERVTSQQYLNGKSSYLALLKAQETSLTLERQAIDAQKSLLNNRVQLYRKLSHGNFDPEQDFMPLSLNTIEHSPTVSASVIAEPNTEAVR
ncbi:MAG: TolC family protein [Thalassotalea sp.]